MSEFGMFPLTAQTRLSERFVKLAGVGLAMVAVLLLTGCQQLWQLGNRDALQADMKTLLGTHGVAPENLQCRMLGATRDAMCRFSLDSPQAERLIKRLRLEAAASRAETKRYIEYIDTVDRQQGGGCVAHPAFGREAKVFAVISRPGQLRLKNGSAFEYFILYHNSHSREVCVRVSYAYG